MGGRLGQHIGEWEKITADSWVLDTIRSGYRLEFTSPPPTGGRVHTTPLPTDPVKAAALRRELEDLKQKRAVIPLPKTSNKPFMSTFFLAPKKGNKWRPIINLRPLNRLIRPLKFKMETLRSILPHLSRNMWATSVDLSDAYLHIPIHPEHQHFLAFSVEGETFQFRALPFGLSTAPRVFTRVTRVVAAFLRRQGIQIFMYLDDWLIVAHDYDTAKRHTDVVVQTASRLGWLVNREKSELEPSQHPTFLGTRLDFRDGRVRPTTERVLAVQAGANLLLERPSAPARAWLVFLGYLASLVDVVPWCLFHMRDLQFHLLGFFVPSLRNLATLVPLTPSVVPHIQWWCDQSHLLLGNQFPPPQPSVVLTTDASLMGWGAHLGGSEVAGHWDIDWQRQHINLLELEAVRRALDHFHPQIRNRSVLVRTDNTTVVAYINRQGGTRSKRLWSLTRLLLEWCMKHRISLQAVHLPGSQNSIADRLSRLRGSHTEWSLSPDLATRLWSRVGLPDVDLFASTANRKLQTFCALTPGQEVWAVDAFTVNWSPFVGYAFPPFSLVHRVLLKVEADGCPMFILIAPNWPGQIWYPLLLRLLAGIPYKFPVRPDLLSIPETGEFHPRPNVLHLTAWPLSANPWCRKAFRQRLPRWQQTAAGPPLWTCILPDWECSEGGARGARLVRLRPL